jgi:hypothetical protein
MAPNVLREDINLKANPRSGFGIDEIPYPAAPAVIIAYPQVQSWRLFFNENGALMGMSAQNAWLQELNKMDPHAKVGSARFDIWSYNLWESMKQAHERFVSRQLNMINHFDTGKALLAELQATHRNVRIFPIEFMRRSFWSTRVGAITSSDNSLAGKLKDAPFIGVKYTGTPYDSIVPCDRHNGTCGKSGHQPPGVPDVHWRGTGGGSDATIFLSPNRVHGEGNDEVLVHELTHATRFMRGISHQMPVSGGYKNHEEFLAMVVENMYRSETSDKPLIDYKKDNINPAKFLDTPLTPAPRLLLALMRSKQPAFFTALAKLNVPFNPIKQVNAAEAALVRRVERA